MSNPTENTDLAPLLAACRRAQPAWAALPLDRRRSHVVAIGRRIVERRLEAMDLFVQDLGRHPTDSLMSELVTAHAYAKGAAALAGEVLTPERVPLSAVEFPGKRAVIERVPRGVVGIVAPWNYPLLQFLKPLFPALLAGNAVVMKPSERTPHVAAWLHGIVAEEVGADLVGLAQGDGSVGAAVVDAVDAVVFTGSVRTGRQVAARAAERLIPASLELGGNDAALVLADADIDRTAAGLAYWAFHNAGQDCSSVERIYVEHAIADAFVDRLVQITAALDVHPEGSGDLPPLQNAEQLGIVEDHVRDAVDHGATVRTGGERTGSGLGYRPTVLDHCTDGMRVVQEETFGPVVAVVRVDHAREAVQRANASRYGLNGSVWTQDRVRGEAIARQLDVGIAYVNNHSFAGVVPRIPWTGVKETGTGIAGSRHAYGTFCRPHTVIVDEGRNPDVFWFPTDPELARLGHAVAELGLGRVSRLLKLPRLLRSRTRRILDLGR